MNINKNTGCINPGTYEIIIDKDYPINNELKIYKNDVIKVIYNIISIDIFINNIDKRIR